MEITFVKIHSSPNGDRTIYADARRVGKVEKAFHINGRPQWFVFLGDETEFVTDTLKDAKRQIAIRLAA